MPTPDRTHHNVKRLGVVFAASAVALLVVTVWMLLADSRRGWKEYQADGPKRIEQICLPDLTVDYHFCQVGRVDRCVTCHQDIDSPANSFKSHPRLDLMVGSDSPHPMEQFGCTVCHAGQGSATEFKFASHTPSNMQQRAKWRERHGWFPNKHWDYPMLAGRFVESGCLRCHPDVTDLEPSRRFPDPPAPKLMAGYHLVRQYGCFGCHEINGFSPRGQRVGPDMRLEPSGTMRKVGPSLRDVGTRLDRAFLADWIAEPAHFRPDSRMPRLFGHHAHLDSQAKKTAQQLEAAEIGALAEWLASRKQPVKPLDASTSETLGATAGSSSSASITSLTDSAKRGRHLLLTQGCLACHRHDDYPESTGTQGPNLSRLGAKYTRPEASQWLADWLRDPARHAPRTLMPNPLLESLVESDGAGEGSAVKKTDPAADLVAYLLKQDGAKDWRPKASQELSDEALDELVLSHLIRHYAQDEAKRILEQGLSGAKPQSDDNSQSDNKSKTEPRPLGSGPSTLVNASETSLTAPLTRQKKLDYAARQTIAKRGCFGCHDIAGFEQSRPIGPALSEWGRKDASLLAFGRVDELLQADGTVDHAKTDPDVGFYVDAVRGRRREGFLWQKLRDPRSFDHGQPADRPPHEWLKMGRFTLDDDQREAIATFVLGLVAQPPTEKYVPHPKAARQAVIEGRKVLDRYACAECHIMEMDRWRVEHNIRRTGKASPPDESDFPRPQVTHEQLEASLITDSRGMAQVDLIGMPRLAADGRPAVFEGDKEDAEGEPLPLRAFSLWEPAAIAGEPRLVGGPDVLLYDDQIVKKYPAWGGTATGPLYAAALADARTAGVNLVGEEAWGRLPPPLVGEGAKVRPDWLAGYLLDPQTVRPAAMMRMPKYTLSTDEVEKLIDFFVAHDGASRVVAEHSPSRDRKGAVERRPGRNPAYDLFSRVPSGRLTTAEVGRLDQAARLLADRKTFCAKCHVLGTEQPGGTATTVAPDLENVGDRLRRDYVRRWLAHPKAVLPYTPMPVNFPPTGEPLGQDLLPGNSEQQIDAIVELLDRYDEYLREKTSIREMVK